MLRYFALHAGKVLSKQRLVEHLWAENQERDSNLVEVYVRRLRDKLGDAAIETRRGQGYVLKDPVS
jgi:DNA-binding response OmpR family regulator